MKLSEGIGRGRNREGRRRGRCRGGKGKGKERKRNRGEPPMLTPDVIVDDMVDVIVAGKTLTRNEIK